MRKTRVTIRETVKHNTQSFNEHNFRFYGRHIAFWNHSRNKVLHPVIAQTYSGKVTKAFFKFQGVAERHAKKLAWGILTVTVTVTVRGLIPVEN